MEKKREREKVRKEGERTGKRELDGDRGRRDIKEYGEDSAGVWKGKLCCFCESTPTIYTSTGVIPGVGCLLALYCTCLYPGSLSRPIGKTEHSGEHRRQPSTRVSEDNHEAGDRFVSEVYGKSRCLAIMLGYRLCFFLFLLKKKKKKLETCASKETDDRGERQRRAVDTVDCAKLC